VLKGEQTRKEIVARALEVASQVGLEGVTLGGLAEDLGISKSGLFAHFKSKEALQLEALQEIVDRFVATVVRPALSHPRGEPRVAALFENDLRWIKGSFFRGGCLLISLSYEYDDRPGPIRDLLVSSQRDWLAVLARAARIATEEGHFRADLDCEQFAYQLQSLCMGYQYNSKLLGDRKAEDQLRGAFEQLLVNSRAPAAATRRARADQR
jgi:AcrR family transcriptional regulator